MIMMEASDDIATYSLSGQSSRECSRQSNGFKS